MVYVRDLMTLFIYSNTLGLFIFKLTEFWIVYFKKVYLCIENLEEILKCYIVFEFEGHVLGTINCYIQNTPFSIDRTCYDFVNGYFIRQRETFNKKICVIVCVCGGGEWMLGSVVQVWVKSYLSQSYYFIIPYIFPIILPYVREKLICVCILFFTCTLNY